jgi:glycosyltransferase involved in cell wall biosynthesis
MSGNPYEIAVVLPAWPGQPERAELERLSTLGEAPAVDYVELVRALDADLIDGPYMSAHAAPLSRLLGRWLGVRLAQALEVFLRRRRYRQVLVWSDRLGLAIALLFRLAPVGRPQLVLLTSWLASPRRARALRWALPAIDAIICDGSKQVEILAERYGVPQARLHLALQGVDARFWRVLDEPDEPMICAVGQQDRDYGTLLEAVRGLELRVEVVAGGVDATSPALDASINAAIPPNVSVRTSCSKPELRLLCARARFIVIPTDDVEFAAGSTALKEAMAMGKAVVVTRSRGQVDYVRHNVNGLYVPPCDPAALRGAILYLLGHPEEAARMGRAGRALVEERLTLAAYVARLVEILREAAARAPAPQAAATAAANSRLSERAVGAAEKRER